MSDELLKRLETGHDKECAMSYGMHEHCCDCSYPARQEAAARVRELEARLEREKKVHDCATTFHAAAIKERDYERARVRELESRLAMPPWKVESLASADAIIAEMTQEDSARKYRDNRDFCLAQCEELLREAKECLTQHTAATATPYSNDVLRKIGAYFTERKWK